MTKQAFFLFWNASFDLKTTRMLLSFRIRPYASLHALKNFTKKKNQNFFGSEDHKNILVLQNTPVCFAPLAVCVVVCVCVCVCVCVW